MPTKRDSAKMFPILQPRPMTRRELIFRAGTGFSGLALAHLLDRDGLLAADPDPAGKALAVKEPHFRARAKSVIFLFMYGGPSHVDLFDPKPALAKWHGKPIPVWKPEDAFMGRKTVNI